MLIKKERTLARYMRAGALMRLYKTLGAKMLVCAGGVLSKSDSKKIMNVMEKIDAVCSNAEENMFRDHPGLPRDYIDVFYGSTAIEARNDVEREVLRIAREAADELFDGESDREKTRRSGGM